MRVWQYTNLKIAEDRTAASVGGVETHILSVSRELRALGHDVYIGPDAPEDWLKNDSLPLFVHTHGDLWPTPSVIWKLRRNASIKWLPVCHGTSIGRVLACEEYFSLSGWKGSLRDFIPTRAAHAAVTVSNQALSEARRYFRMHLPAHVIPNGADGSVFKPLEEIAVEPNVIFLGRGEDRVKNTAALLETSRKLALDHPDFKLFAAPGLAANGARYPFLRNLGPTFGEDLYRAIARCRALVLCSLYEGDPVVLHEAKAMGVGIIASDLPQLREALSGYRNSWFVDPRVPESLLKGMNAALFQEARLTPSPSLRDWAEVAKEFEQFYSELLKRS